MSLKWVGYTLKKLANFNPAWFHALILKTNTVNLEAKQLLWDPSCLRQSCSPHHKEHQSLRKHYSLNRSQQDGVDTRRVAGQGASSKKRYLLVCRKDGCAEGTTMTFRASKLQVMADWMQQYRPASAPCGEIYGDRRWPLSTNCIHCTP